MSIKLPLTAATILISFASPYLIFSHSQPILAQALKTTSEEEIVKAVNLNVRGQEIVYTELVSIEGLNTGLEMFQQALAIFRKYKATDGEASSLVNIGYVYLQKGEYQKALEFFQPALDIYRKNRNRENEWIPLSYMGKTYVNLSNYAKALAVYQPALVILQELKTANPKTYSYGNSEKSMLSDIGAIYFRLGQYQKALEFYQQHLAMEKADNNRINSAEITNNIGVIYLNLGNYAQAIDHYQQALNTVQDYCYEEKLTCFYGLEAAIWNNLGSVYFSLGQYQKALESSEKSSAIYTKLNSSEYKNATKRDIELLYSALGNNPQAIQQITSRANVGDAFGNDFFQFQGKALNLNNIGQIYLGLGKYNQALNVYQQALNIYKNNNYKSGIAFTLNNIGRIYQNQGKYDQAKELNQQALKNYQELGDRTGEGVTISNLGQIYQQQNQDTKAFELYQQALIIHREIGDKVSESATLKFIGDVLFNQKQSQLAIAFYKQSVNLTENIRQNLRFIPINIQKSYTETVSERYRRLADVLLQQNRPAEAQEVLDLLKIQEVVDFIGDSQRSPTKTNITSNNNQRSPDKITTSSTAIVSLKPQEQEITQKYNAIQDKAISLGKELTELRKIPQKNRTATQAKRIAELVKSEQQITAEFNKFIKSPSVVSLVQQLSVTTRQENLNLRQLNSIRDNLKQLNQKAVLLYPLVLDDRLELVIVSADAPPIHRTVQIKKAELDQLVTQFRQDLTRLNPPKDVRGIANKLYNYLIKPIENDLKQAEAKAIIYAPDDRLRYIPLAALYDGNNWLVQRFIINNITAASLTKLDNKPQKNLQTLAAAFTKGKYTVNLSNERQAEFSGLEYAKVEVENIAKTIPGTKILLDNQFTPQITIPQMNDYKIVHLATHGLLVSGEPENSFILFGNGEKVTLGDIENWSLPNVDLVVLSACETGLGEKLGNGQEILGLGYQIQLTGAKASIASLWSVYDGGTQALMNEFYKVLKAGNVTKAEALHKAQITLLTDKNNNEFQRPYYWAAFILIGNGL